MERLWIASSWKIKAQISPGASALWSLKTPTAYGLSWTPNLITWMEEMWGEWLIILLCPIMMITASHLTASHLKTSASCDPEVKNVCSNGILVWFDFFFFFYWISAVCLFSQIDPKPCTPRGMQPEKTRAKDGWVRTQKCKATFNVFFKSMFVH